MVVKGALDDMAPLEFVGWRFLLGAAALALIAVPRGRKMWIHGTTAGIALFAGYALQTAGLQFTSAANSALITGLYVVITPLLVALLLRRAPSPWVVVGSGMAFVGLALITGVQDLSLGTGDLLTIGCAIGFSAHIVILSRYAKDHPLVAFTVVQLAVTSGLAFLGSMIFEQGLTLPPPAAWSALVITGLGVSAGAFLLQIWAQKIVGAATAAVVLAAEPAFGVAAAWVVLSERLTPRGWAGALTIVVAIVVVVIQQRDEGSRSAEAITPAH